MVVIDAASVGFPVFRPTKDGGTDGGGHVCGQEERDPAVVCSEGRSHSAPSSSRV